MNLPTYSSKMSENILIDINNKRIPVRSISVQTSIGTFGTVFLSIDNKPENIDFFKNLLIDESKFDMISDKFHTQGSSVKSMNTSHDDNFLNVSILFDIINQNSRSERRDILINKILGD